MTLSIFLLCILVYVLMIALVNGFLEKALDVGDVGWAPPLAVFWPLTIIGYMLYIVFYLTYLTGKTIGGYIANSKRSRMS